MIKYLEPREFYCAVITAFIGPFSLCLRGPLCLLSAQAEMVPAPSAGGLFMGSEDIWNMWWGWKEEEQRGWRDRDHHELQQPWRRMGIWPGETWNTFSFKSTSDSWKTCTKVRKGRERLSLARGRLWTVPVSLHKWALFFFRAATLTPQGCFCAGKSKVKQVPWSRKVWWELKTFLHKWRGYSPVPMEHTQGLGSLRGKKNIYRVEKAKKWRFGDFGWLRRCVAPQILQDLTTTSLSKSTGCRLMPEAFRRCSDFALTLTQGWNLLQLPMITRESEIMNKTGSEFTKIQVKVSCVTVMNAIRMMMFISMCLLRFIQLVTVLWLLMFHSWAAEQTPCGASDLVRWSPLTEGLEECCKQGCWWQENTFLARFAVEHVYSRNGF